MLTNQNIAQELCLTKTYIIKTVKFSFIKKNMWTLTLLPTEEALGFLTAGCLRSINTAKFQMNSHPYSTVVMKQASLCRGGYACA